MMALSGREITFSEESTQVFAASFRKGHRSSSVSTGAAERVFISQFSMRGVLMASHLTSDLCEVAKAVESWLVDELTLRDMKQKLPHLDVSELSFETEAGRGVAARWNSLLLAPHEEDPIWASWLTPELRVLLRAAARRPLLRQLVPVVSMGRNLAFSRTLGYPFAMVSACRISAASGRFIASKKDGTQLAEGGPEEMLDIVEGELPPDIGPAIFGTADDLE
jgi:Family of unknown function (DUF6193)